MHEAIRKCFVDVLPLKREVPGINQLIKPSGAFAPGGFDGLIFHISKSASQVAFVILPVKVSHVLSAWCNI